MSTNYGMFRAPAVRFGIAGQLGGDADRYTFSALGAEVMSVNVTHASGDIGALNGNETVVDATDMKNADIMAAVKSGLEQLAQILEPIAPLTRNYLVGIME